MSEYFSHRTHHAGGMVLILSGAVDIIAGLVGGVAAVTPPYTLGQLFPILLSYNITPTLFYLGAAVLLVVGSFEIIAGMEAMGSRHWYWSMAGCILGFVFIVTVPLNLLAGILIGLSEGQFPREE